MTKIDEFLGQRMDTKSVATALGVKTGTLDKWASTGVPHLPHYKIASRRYYMRSDVEAFIEKRRRTHTGEAA